MAGDRIAFTNTYYEIHGVKCPQCEKEFDEEVSIYEYQGLFKIYDDVTCCDCNYVFTVDKELTENGDL
jgi:ssDNA-binding Zn-finger/Zn-ribbon topoisomerase 1